jgi:hypothetical protein
MAIAIKLVTANHSVGKVPLFIEGEKECITAYTPAALIDDCPDSRRIILVPGGSWQRS